MVKATRKDIKRPGDAKHGHLQNITKEKLMKFLPKGSGHDVSDRVLELIANIEDDTGLEQGYMEEQVLTHTSIFKGKKIKLDDYVNAVKYCTLVGNLSNRKAWEITFPDRLAKAEARIAEETAKKERGEKWVEVAIDTHVHNYNKTPLVVELRARMAIPFDIANAPLRQWALMQTAQLARGIAAPTPDGDMMVVTPTVQQAALATIMSELKPAVDNKMELTIGVSDEVIASNNNLAEQMSKMAEAQRAALQSGRDITEVQKIGISFTEAEVIDE